MIYKKGQELIEDLELTETQMTALSEGNNIDGLIFYYQTENIVKYDVKEIEIIFYKENNKDKLFAFEYEEDKHGAISYDYPKMYQVEETTGTELIVNFNFKRLNNEIS